MTALLKYDAACLAIAEAKSVDEAKDMHDKAEAMRIYARQAGNRELEIDAAEIRVRAEHRLGELLIAAKEAGQLGEGRPPKNGQDDGQFPRVRLADVGIDRNLSSRAQKLGRIREAALEGMIARLRSDMSEKGARVSLDLLKTETKTERRAVREKVLGGILHALPKRKYGVILADPEWRFEVYSRVTGMDRAADNHYPTSGTDAICARPVGDIAADDCALFLWATVPMLPDALKVMQAWGFTYKSHAVWVKDRIGTGYWFRNAHELLLVGTKGNVPAPAMGTQAESAVHAPVGKHSAKPECFLEMIEAYFPTLPKIELNRRGPPRPGWDAWGNEAEPVDSSGTPLAHDDDTGDIIEPEAQHETTGSSPSSAPTGDEPKASVMASCPHDAGAGDRPQGHPPQPIPDIEIPAFLRRCKDNSLPEDRL